MELQEALQERHSVRDYTDQPIDPAAVRRLEEEIAACDQAGGLHIQLATGEPEAFTGLLPHYGKFRGVRNYLAMVGPKGPALEEAVGYYGQRLVLCAQQLGLNSCWVALTFRKGKVRCEIAPGEKLACVISLGYGVTQGVPHKSRPMADLCRVDGDMPDWFRRGMEAAMLAPTAMNQQRFRFTLQGDTVALESTGGFYSHIDLGIVKYQFEVGAAGASFRWAL